VKKILVAFRHLLTAAGVVFVFCLLFAFTTGPFYLYHWLGTSEGSQRFRPTHVIVLGGGGFPGENSLLRCWYASKLIDVYPYVRVLLSQAASSPGDSSETAAASMRRELILRGADSTLIGLMSGCRNTREEALQAARHLPNDARIILITSPEHMRRAVKCFRKAGLTTVGGLPTFSDPGEADLRYNDRQMGGNRIPLPAVGQSTQLRYQFWNHLRYQLLCCRELIALGWYALRGWT
jgi:uncharacterized SAM-binding protein YcdF (DUF218 family)